MTDVGQCQNCNHIFKISKNISNEQINGFEIDSPPKGAWIKREFNQVIIGATTRSPSAFFLVPFMLVWSGGSLGGIYGKQIMNSQFDPALSLFGIPFILGSIIFWAAALMTIFGKVELTLDKFGGKIFTGIGKIGINKKFSWKDISTVSETQSNLKYPGSQGVKIQLEGKTRISFGAGVNEGRRYFLTCALKSIIEKVKTNKNFI